MKGKGNREELTDRCKWSDGRKTMCQSTLTILGLGLKNRHQRAVNPSMAYAQVQAMNLGTSTQVF